MPYLVRNLMQGKAAPVTIGRDEKATQALDLMIDHDYSQLPVIDKDKCPLGIVTYEGILRGVRNFGTELDNLRVREIVMPAKNFTREDSLFDLLEPLKTANAVLIVDSAGRLTGIVTAYDSIEYFRNRAEDMMHVEDIELTVKEFIKLAYVNGDGDVDEDKLAAAITKISKPTAPQAGAKPGKFEDLSLGQYIALLGSNDTWPILGPVFGLPHNAVLKLLGEVRRTRNDLAHFRKEISAYRSDQLRYCADWLARCREEYDRMHEATLTHPALVFELAADGISTATGPILGQPVLEVRVPDRDQDAAREPRLVAEESQPTDNRYAPLADWLRSQPGQIDIVRLSFQDIEAIIGGRLPDSAYVHRAWWANDKESHPQSRLWLEAGWRTSTLNLTDRRVTFNRIRERERDYIDFFSKLLAELRKQANFQIREASPDGASWLICRTIPATRTVGQFNYSFSRGRRFRVELYLDAQEQEATKGIFDQIHQRRESIEAALGEVSWERIDAKRASRIAVYCDGDIQDSESELTELRGWAAPKMVAFVNAVEPVAIQAIQEVLKL